jgi:glutamate N-acetyltransferase/amino-acid N-acetyltransferase
VSVHPISYAHYPIYRIVEHILGFISAFSSRTHASRKFSFFLDFAKSHTLVVNQSYNSISVDGDESTSDTVALVASHQVAGTDEAEFAAALLKVCQGLAADIVRNGEGTSHVMRVSIANLPGTDQEARRLGRHIVNSPLFKCAVSGNDPNTGRLAAAIGSFMGKFLNDEDVGKMELTLGGRTIFSKGKFVLEGQEVEEELSQHMKDAQFNEHADFPEHQKFVESTYSNSRYPSGRVYDLPSMISL